MLSFLFRRFGRLAFFAFLPLGVWGLGCTNGFDIPDGSTQNDGSPKEQITTSDQPPNPDQPPPSDQPPNPDQPVDPEKTPNPDGPANPEKTPNPDGAKPEGNPLPEPPPKEAFKLISAFSRNGKDITLRFNNPVDPATALLENFRTIPRLQINEAKVETNFVQLIIDPGSQIQKDTVYEARVEKVKDTFGQDLDPAFKVSTIKRSLYVNLVWHQHQPMYLDPLKDEMQGPWVRKHATKSYYDMASVLEKYPDVHMTINLTAVLLVQLYRYIERIGPHYDPKTNRIRAQDFLAKWKGKTDPWIDLLLEATPDPAVMSKRQKGLFYDDPWATVSTSPQVMRFWPEYELLRDKNRAQYTKDDLLKLKFFFEIAWFDPDFTKGPTTLPDGQIIDLSDIVEERNGKKYVKVPITEDLCNRIVAENYKVMANVVGIHKKLMYNYQTKKGQIEVITTPFYHPILPLVFDTNLGKKTPFTDDIVLPPQRFSYPQDAFDHVAKARFYYRQLFGLDPQGMWPGEGSVAEEVVGLFIQNGVRWIATGEDNLRRSKPEGLSLYQPYRVDSDTTVGTSKDELMIVFRDNKISDLIGFGIQNLPGEQASNTLLAGILAHAPRFGEPDRLVTIILDGENAWENFTVDYDAKDFFNKFYGALQRSFQIGEILSVTPVEYIDGNPARNVPAHPIAQLREIEPLNAGSWIDGTFRVWIGEAEETCGWLHLLRARQDLERSGIPRPNPMAPAPPETSPAYNAYRAWESMYAAEGSDWFWWFGDDMTTPANDDSGFDSVFRALLVAVYEFSNKAGATLAVPNFRPCVQPKPKPVPDRPCTSCPSIDGRLNPGISEWTDDGGFVKDPDSAGEIPDPDDDIDSVFIAFDLNKLYIGLLSNDEITQKLGTNYQMIVYFSHRNILDRQTGKTKDDPFNKQTPGGIELVMKPGGAARRLILDFQGTSVKANLEKADGNGGWAAQTSTAIQIAGPIKGNKLLELAIPWTDLNLVMKVKEYDPLEILIVAVENGKELDRAPNFGSFVVFEDASDAVFVTFEVDVSGSQEPINKYGNCCKEQPKPTGPASAYIVGNHPNLGMVGVDAQGKPIWIPNKIQMTQDAQNPHLYRFTLPLPNSFKVNYKYTLGTNSDEGRWTGTEEFPVTFRGFSVVDPSGKRCIRVRDIFANKPTAGRDGEIGSKSVFETGCTR